MQTIKHNGEDYLNMADLAMYLQSQIDATSQEAARAEGVTDVTPEISAACHYAYVSLFCVMAVATGRDTSVFADEDVKMAEEAVNNIRFTRAIFEGGAASLQDTDPDCAPLADWERELLDGIVHCEECGHRHFVEHQFDQGGHYITCPICPPGVCRDDTA